jgi:hypothetical protein
MLVGLRVAMLAQISSEEKRKCREEKRKKEGKKEKKERKNE